jgi:putative ABC transport system permease protein
MEEGLYKNLVVVGVVDDYVYGNMYGKPGPVLFYCEPSKGNLLYVRIKPQANPVQLLTKIEAVMKKHNPAYPLEYKFVDDQFNNLFLNEMLISKASGVFATLAIIISCLGLFGLAAYTAERRTKEIGVRKVLGASVTRLAGLLSKDFLQLVVISCLVAFPVAWWIMHDWLQSYEYRIALQWWVFLAAGLMAIFIALITVSTQAIKAAMANPVKTLRME